MTPTTCTKRSLKRGPKSSSHRSATARSNVPTTLTSTKRNIIERFFNKLKQFRRVATRYDKLLANFMGFVKLAAIAIWLR